MPARQTSLPRLRQPVLELVHSRNPALGYEPVEQAGAIRCLAHGYPTPLARWHYHDEYELHLITASSGKAFVGDYIGSFSAGHLVLTGPRLPHNWVSLEVPTEGYPLRDLVIQFDHAPLEKAASGLPELREILPLLERSRHGIEFFGLSECAENAWHKIRESQGLARLAAFCELLSGLARCTNYRLLSAVRLQSDDNHLQLDQINVIVNRITTNFSQEISADELAREFGMTASRFSRFFRRATGNSFSDFVTQVRINQACRMLMMSDRPITQICYDVGFNNVANFNRRFLDLKGMTPSAFRRSSDHRFGILV